MSTIRGKIIMTLLALVVLAVLSTVAKVTDYSVSQQYAKEAVKQLDPDHEREAYRVLQTQSGAGTVMLLIRLVLAVLIVISVVVMWLPSKDKKKINKKIGKVY